MRNGCFISEFPFAQIEKASNEAKKVIILPVKSLVSFRFCNSEKVRKKSVTLLF